MVLVQRVHRGHQQPAVGGCFTQRQLGLVPVAGLQVNRPWIPWIAVDDDAWRFKPHSKRLFLVEGKIGLSGASVDALRLSLEALPPVGRKRNPLG